MMGGGGQRTTVPGSNPMANKSIKEKRMDFELNHQAQAAA